MSSNSNSLYDKCIFYAKTSNGYIFKILIEILQHYINIGDFTLDSDLISIKSDDEKRAISIDVKLRSEGFSYYHCKSKLAISINMSLFYKMLKNVKKKDSIAFYILNEKPNILYIQTFPKENKRIVTTNLKIHPIQNIGTVPPSDYINNVYIIPATEYQKMCKEINDIGKITEIYSKNNVIVFRSKTDEIYGKEVEFPSEDTPVLENVEYKSSFKTNKLTNLSKISGLTSGGGNIDIKIYTQFNYPLLIKAPIGCLGDFAIYIKSEEIIELEKQIEEEYDSDIE
jgi:hypothetical protein